MRDKLLFIGVLLNLSCATTIHGREPAMAKRAGFLSKRIAQYESLSSDTLVTDNSVLLNTSITNSSSAPIDVLIESDGRYFPAQGTAFAGVQIYVDSDPVGNNSAIDWRGSLSPAQHTFNAIALVNLSPGTHEISLVAKNNQPNTSFKVGALSNLSILQSSASSTLKQSLSSDSPEIDGLDQNMRGQNIPLNPILSFDSISGSSILLFSGSVYWTGSVVPGGTRTQDHWGDAMIGISLNGETCPKALDQSYSVNDQWNGAELQAPLFSQGISNASTTISPVVFGAGFPWLGQPDNDTVKFKTTAGSTFIALENPQIMSAFYNQKLSQTPDNPADQCMTHEYVCIGTSMSIAGCPSAGMRTVLAEGDIEIPANHDGVVMVLAKTRVQPSPSTTATGLAFLGLQIDGKDIGSHGVQQAINHGNGSQRTISASFLTSGSNTLSPGTHHIQAWMQVEGDNPEWQANRDLSLLIFD